MRLRLWSVTLLLLALLGSCRDREPASSSGRSDRKPPPAADARARRSLLPVRPAAKPAERAFDRQRLAAHRAVLLEARQLYDVVVALAREMQEKPHRREGWAGRRDAVLKRVGKLRVQVLQIDPLGRRSWAGKDQRLLLRLLGVRLLDGIQASWGEKGRGALGPALADAEAVMRRLSGYLRGLEPIK